MVENPRSRRRQSVAVASPAKGVLRRTDEGGFANKVSTRRHTLAPGVLAAATQENEAPQIERRSMRSRGAKIGLVAIPMAENGLPGLGGMSPAIGGRVGSPIRRTRDFTPLSRFVSPDAAAAAASPGTVLEQYLITDSPNTEGRCGAVLFVRDAQGPGQYAAKWQSASRRTRPQVAREFILHRELAQLHYRSQCFNFVLMYDCVQHPDPDPLGGLAKNSPLGVASRRSSRRIPQPANRESLRSLDSNSDSSVYYILEKGHESLHSYVRRKSLSLVEFREIWFQLLYALLVSGREFGFTHYDLHLRNVLVADWPNKARAAAFFDAPSAEPSATTAALDAAWFASHVAIKLADFGLSRMEVQDSDGGDATVLYNAESLDHTVSLWQPEVDVSKLLGELKKYRPSEIAAGSTGYRVWLDFVHLLNHPLSYRDRFEWLRQALRHAFLADLSQPPSGISHLETVAVSVQGMDGIPREYLSSILFHTERPLEF